MANKLITPEGKTQMLRYALGGADEGSFKYLALGDGQSSGASNGDFSELTDNNYRRVEFETQTSSADSRSITLTAIFEDDNYNPSQGGYVSEIGIVNNPQRNAQQDVFFAYAEIPKILKSDNISLKYTIVISVL